MSKFYFKSVILIIFLRSFTILFCVFNKFCSKVYYNDIEKIWFLSKQLIV